MSGFEVLHPGALTTVQDLGRPGLAHLGIPRSGAADRRSLVLANTLVGNAEGAACLETTLVGPRLRLLQTCTVAITGASVNASVGERRLDMDEAVELEAGDVLKVGTARRGLRTYIAFRGGIAGESWFGSRATDVLTGLGPPPLAAGALLEIGVSTQSPAEDGTTLVSPLADEPVLELFAGPRADWFSEGVAERLVTEAFRVSSDSNRVGLRLEGSPLTHHRESSLRSEGLAHGSLQVPPSGQPILMLADHPTTGGYPVIAVVCSRDLPQAGQLRPGQSVRFRLRDR